MNENKILETIGWITLGINTTVLIVLVTWYLFYN